LAVGTINFYTQAFALPAIAIDTQPPSVPCYAGSGINTAITINMAAAGAGGLVSIEMWGYQQ
jgi:hypothetical protein